MDLVHRRVTFQIIMLLAICASASAEAADDAKDWSWGVSANAGYFNFRNSLYVDREPDSPGEHGDDWFEFVVKPWADFEKPVGEVTWFGRATWAYVRTDKNAAEISGGHADSADFDELYLGFRNGSIETGQLEIAAGRYSYQLAHAYLLADGYADGGSRGGYWSNARMAWAATDLWSISFIIAHNQPGDAIEEAHERTQAFEYAMVYATFRLSK